MQKIPWAFGLMTLLVACADDPQSDPASGTSGQKSQAAAFNVECMFHDQPAVNPTGVSLKVGDDLALTASALVGEHSVSLSYSPAGEDVATLHVRVGTQLTTLYQLDPASPPKNIYLGEHGFTGLVYVGSLQYVCKVL